MAAGEIPKITWGASFANTWELGYPLDLAVAWSEPRILETAMTPAGSEDSWTPATDYFLTGFARWIPPANGTTPDGTTITGWDGATGVDAALAWLRAKNEGKFYPLRSSGTNKTFKLKEPLQGQPALEFDGKKKTKILIRATDAAAFTGF